MKCPVCNIDLVMADRIGVEIDYCPTCRGIWLDRGKLDKIIDRSLASGPQQLNQQYSDHDDDQDNRGGFGKQGRRRSLFDLFD